MTSTELTEWMAFYELEQEDHIEAVEDAKAKAKAELEKAKAEAA